MKQKMSISKKQFERGVIEAIKTNYPLCYAEMIKAYNDLDITDIYNFFTSYGLYFYLTRAQYLTSYVYGYSITKEEDIEKVFDQDALRSEHCFSVENNAKLKAYRFMAEIIERILEMNK